MTNIPRQYKTFNENIQKTNFYIFAVMNTYNKIMLKFWLFVGIFLVISTTYFGFQEGFQTWGFYYVFAGIAFLMYFMRRWMMKRYEKHQEFLKGREEEVG